MKVVQKYGGTSVATPDHIRRVAKRVVETKRKGSDVTVIVSAMAHETDRLLNLAQAFGAKPKANSEADLVASTGETISAALMALAIQAEGEDAKSLLGFQLPILTTGDSGQARIVHVNVSKIEECFEKAQIPVIAGFQGVDSAGRITTLGRGGSDTSAVAIAATLGGVPCEIYTDVSGVFSADPRVCPDALPFSQVSYHFMLEAAKLGAKVLCDRSVAIGHRYQVPIRVRSTFEESTGTVIHNEETNATCITLDRSEARVSLLSNDSLPILSKMFSQLALPFTTLAVASHFEKVITVPKTHLGLIATHFSESIVFVDDDVARISVVGRRASDPSRQIPVVLSVLGEKNITCLGLSVGAMSMSFLVSDRQSVEMVRVLHQLYCNHNGVN